MQKIPQLLHEYNVCLNVCVETKIVTARVHVDDTCARITTINNKMTERGQSNCDSLFETSGGISMKKGVSTSTNEIIVGDVRQE